MHAGKIVDATVKAVIERTDGLRLQVDFGFNQTALIHVWQVIENWGWRSLRRTRGTLHRQRENRIVCG